MSATRPDLVVVGSGPAGAATALGALHADPTLHVVLLDRAEFPRDKPCGDGVAPHVLDLLAEVGAGDVLADRVPIRRLRLARAGRTVERTMERPAYVVPRRVLDARLLEAARSAGADVRRARVRTLRVHRDGVVLDGGLAAPVVVGADGARSTVRRLLGRERGPQALALRGYAPTLPEHAGRQVIALGTEHQPAYAWSFDRGDGRANIGYGELLGRAAVPTRRELLDRLEALLPGATREATDWAGHHLPLSTRRWDPPRGRVLLVGDAAGLVNPMTGEGIFYAVATGMAAGRAAAAAVAAGDPASAGSRYRATTRRLLARHLRHTALASRLSRVGPVLDAGLRASDRDQRIFDDLVELGLARGRLTPALLGGMGRALLTPGRRPPEP